MEAFNRRFSNHEQKNLQSTCCCCRPYNKLRAGETEVGYRGCTKTAHVQAARSTENNLQSLWNYAGLSIDHRERHRGIISPFWYKILRDAAYMCHNTFPVKNGRPRTKSLSTPMLILTITLCVIVLLPLPPVFASGLGGHAKRHGRRHASSRSQASHQPIDPMEYLMKFGYLPRGDLETGALRTNEEIKRAIKNFQRFARLNQTGVLDGPTRRQMLKPRCGNADIITNEPFPLGRTKRFVIASSKWHKNDLTFRILNYSPDMTQGEIRDSIIRAFDVWAKVTNLAFYEKTTGPADLMIRFTKLYHHDGYPFDGKGSVLAHAFYPGDDRGGDIHFDDDELWTFQGDKGVSLFSVATHEIGHSLGLAHSQVPPALMYPWYSGSADSVRLHSDDIVAIQFLYGEKSPSHRPGVTPAYTIVPGTLNPAPTVDIRTYRPGTKVAPTTPAVTTRSPRYGPGNKPDPCTQSVRLDATATIRREIFLFSGVWFWRISGDGEKVTPAYYFHNFWTGLPRYITRIDAAYEAPDDHIIFFTGDKYFKMTNNRLSRGFPPEGRFITDFGFPKDIKQVDAAFRWSYNDMTFFITGDMYWKYDEQTQKMFSDYPRDMGIWSGVPVPVDATLSVKEKTYFFKDAFVWQFNDIRMSVKKSRYPKLWSVRFLKCENQAVDIAGVYEDSKRTRGPYFVPKTGRNSTTLDQNSATVVTVKMWQLCVSLVVVLYMQYVKS